MFIEKYVHNLRNMAAQCGSSGILSVGGDSEHVQWTPGLGGVPCCRPGPAGMIVWGSDCRSQHFQIFSRSQYKTM